MVFIDFTKKPNEAVKFLEGLNQDELDLFLKNKMNGTITPIIYPQSIISRLGTLELSDFLIATESSSWSEA